MATPFSHKTWKTIQDLLQRCEAPNRTGLKMVWLCLWLRLHRCFTGAAVWYETAKTVPFNILFSNREASACHFLHPKKWCSVFTPLVSTEVPRGSGRAPPSGWLQLANSQLPQQRQPKAALHVASSVCLQTHHKNVPHQCVCVRACKYRLAKLASCASFSWFS